MSTKGNFYRLYIRSSFHYLFIMFFKMLTDNQKGMLLALLGYTAFAISDLCVKILNEDYSTIQIVMIIMFACSMLLLALSPIIKNDKPLFKTKHLKLHIFRGVMNVIIALLFLTALSKLTLANAYTIVFAKPFFAVILGMIFYAEKPTLKRWIVIAVGFIGVLIAMQPSSGFEPMMLAPLFAAVFAALMFIVSKSLKGDSIFQLGFYPAIISAFLCFPIVMWNGFTPIQLPHIPFFALSSACISVGMIAVSRGYGMGESGVVGPIHYTQIIWGILFGFLIFGDVPNIMTLIGASVIIASGLYLVWDQRKKSC